MESIRVFVNDRLAAAANEICRVFESTIAEYQEEIYRSKQEIEQLRSMRKAVLKIKLKRTDAQQHSNVSSAEMVPEHQHETPGLDREHPELKEELKDENEELCISQRNELLIPTRELETPYRESCCDQDKANSSHVGAGVKYRETDIEPLPSSSTVIQIKTEPGEEDCKLTEVTEPISGNLLSSAAQSEHIILTTLTAEKEQSVKKNKITMVKKSNLNPDSGSLKRHKCSVKQHGFHNCVTTQLESYDSVQADSVQAGQSHDGVQARQSHDSVKAGENLVHCSVCNYGVNTSAEMEVHMEKHLRGKHSCHVCGKVYTTPHHLTVHLRVHTGNKPHLCTECGKGFKTNWERKVHLRIHTGERPYCCTHCSMTFKQSAHLAWHMSRHTREKPISQRNELLIPTRELETPYMESHCDQDKANSSHVGEPLPSSSTVSQIKTEPGEEDCKLTEVTEPISGNLLSSAAQSEHITLTTLTAEKSLVLNKRIHTGEKPYSCHDCAKCFIDSGSLKRHKCGVKQHGFHNCVTTQLESYDSVQAGQNHDSVQAGENLVHCSVCNYGVNTSAEMEVHMEKHLRGKHSCHVCGKVYSTPHHLTVHLRVHTGNKPHLCSECGKGFKTNYELKVHLRIHTGERPYCCTHCTMRFKQSAHLVWHMRRHTREKPNQSLQLLW